MEEREISPKIFLRLLIRRSIGSIEAVDDVLCVKIWNAIGIFFTEPSVSENAVWPWWKTINEPHRRWHVIVACILSLTYKSLFLAMIDGQYRVKHRKIC